MARVYTVVTHSSTLCSVLMPPLLWIGSLYVSLSAALRRHKTRTLSFLAIFFSIRKSPQGCRSSYNFAWGTFGSRQTTTYTFVGQNASWLLKLMYGFHSEFCKPLSSTLLSLRCLYNAWADSDTFCFKINTMVKLKWMYCCCIRVKSRQIIWSRHFMGIGLTDHCPRCHCRSLKRRDWTCSSGISSKIVAFHRLHLSRSCFHLVTSLNRAHGKCVQSKLLASPWWDTSTRLPDLDCSRGYSQVRPLSSRKQDCKPESLYLLLRAAAT